jgi:hypothetical protein
MLKNLITFKGDNANQWPEMHDTDDGTNYLDETLLKDVGRKLKIMWM